MTLMDLPYIRVHQRPFRWAAWSDAASSKKYTVGQFKMDG